MPRGRPRTLLAVPCDVHGDAPCPSTHGCKNRRERAKLPVERPLGKREARSIAAGLIAGWVRSSLDVGAELTGRDGVALDPESREWDLVQNAIDEILEELTAR